MSMQQPLAEVRRIDGGYPVQQVVVVAEPHSMSTASFVLALCSVAFGWTFLMPLGAFILGVVGMRKEPAGRGFAIAGVAISSCFLLVWAAIAAVVLLILGTALAGGAAAATSPYGA